MLAVHLADVGFSNWPVKTQSESTVTHQAIIFGLGSMFNHSSQAQNVVWTRDLEHQTVIYTAMKNIDVGEELCISYGGNLWFKDVDASSTSSEREGDMLESIQLDLDDGDDR